MINEKFGRLTVLAESAPLGGSRAWLCLCECGSEKVVRQAKLRSGHTKSCGCLRVEKGIELGKANIKHGQTNTPEHNAWHHMRQRCLDKNHPGYKDYGGRGITICERWADFNNFLADMGPRPTDRHSLDRIDVNGHYEPSNCRWADDKTQQRNRRNHRLVTYKGETLCIGEWAERCGLTIPQLWARLFIHKWTIERAMTEPVKKKLITS